MILGAQFFTLKDYCKDLDSFSETLKRVADIGYTTVQISGTCEYEADWLAEQLRATGLRCVLTHTKADKILADTKKVCDDHKTFGCRNVGLGMIPGGKGLTEEKYEQFVKDFKPAAKEIVANGCKFFFHNHCEEFANFADGRSCIDRMLEDFTPDELNFTLDTYWVQAGGADPIEWIKKLKGRTPCVHLKDMSYGRRMEALGEGNMNFDGILDACVSVGVDYAFVEQDDCNGEDPFDCLRTSFEFLKSRGFN